MPYHGMYLSYLVCTEFILPVMIPDIQVKDVKFLYRYLSSEGFRCITVWILLIFQVELQVES
jgi:hypothetical protein